MNEIVNNYKKKEITDESNQTLNEDSKVTNLRLEELLREIVKVSGEDITRKKRIYLSEDIKNTPVLSNNLRVDVTTQLYTFKGNLIENILEHAEIYATDAIEYRFPPSENVVPVNNYSKIIRKYDLNEDTLKLKLSKAKAYKRSTNSNE